MKPAAQPVEAGKDRGSLATYELAGRRCSRRTPAHQLTTGDILGRAKVSTNTGGSVRVQGYEQLNQFVPYPNHTSAATYPAGGE
jgi:hypothetical protein